jgi:LysM repeat protein
VVENVYSGMNAGAQQAVNWWSNDGAHMATLISANHQDAGAGMASADGVVYITLLVGSVTGAPGSAETQMAWAAQASDQPTEQGGGAAAAPISIGATSTPAADGSIIHEVASGQTLWTIAALYKIGLADLLRINGLNDTAVIKPGQKIVIQPAGSLPTATFAMLNSEGTPVQTEDAEGQATEMRSPTRTPRLTQTALAQKAGAASPQAEQDEQPGALAVEPAQNTPLRLLGLDPLLVLIGALVLGGAGLLAAGSLLNRGE